MLGQEHIFDAKQYQLESSQKLYHYHQSGGLDERHVRTPVHAGRESVDHELLFTTSQIPRTCASLSLLTARTALCFSSRYCLALRLSSMMFSISLVKKLFYVPGVSRRQLPDTFRNLVLKSVHNLSSLRLRLDGRCLPLHHRYWNTKSSGASPASVTKVQISSDILIFVKSMSIEELSCLDPEP